MFTRFQLPARACALAAAFLVASCGGGGGGGTPAPAANTAPTIAITETNAKPVGANALDAAQSTSATRNAAGLPIGVQVNATDVGAPLLPALAEAARLAAQALPGAALPVGVAVNQSFACPLGGSFTLSGNAASATSISVGDTFTFSANACASSAGGSTVVLNGSMTMNFATATSSLTPPFHIVVNNTVSNLSVTSGGTSVVANGDVRLDWNAPSSTSQTLTASGTSMSSRETINGATHTTTLRNYSQTLTTSGSTYTGTVAGTVETDSSKLGSSPVSYTISTPTPVVWSATTHTASAGVIKVVGANNSAMLLTIHADGTVSIQLDANGDGTYEKTISSTVAELAGLI